MPLDKEVKDAIDGAKAAFGEYKSTMEDLKKTVDGHTVKMDAFDEAKMKKLADDIGAGIEVAQKATAQAEHAVKKAEEAEKKAADLQTAFNRAPATETTEEKAKVGRKKMNKAFNDFARSSKAGGNGQMYFDDFVKDLSDRDPEFKSLTANADPSGGYLVLPQITGPVEQFVYESSPIRQLATVTTIGTDSLEVILDNDQVGSGWVGETDARSTSTTPVFQKVEIPVNELYSNAPATQKMLDDSMMDLEPWLTRKASDKFARDEATAFVTGSGVAKPKGFMSYTSGTDTTKKQIEQVVTGDASNFTYDGVVSLQAKLKEPYQANATFLLQRGSIANIMQIKDGDGRPLFNVLWGTTGQNAGLETTIMGRPIRFAADVAAIGSNALAMAYGDFRRAYQIVDRTGIRILRDPFSSKPNVLFYVTKRVGGGVVNFEAIKIQKIST
jgi:HK97 family phage major capsid protein